MYEINYIDQQFFITKPQDKNSLNWPVGSGLSRPGLQILFNISEKAERIDYRAGMEGLGGGGGGTRIKWAIKIYILLINIMLTDFHH